MTDCPDCGRTLRTEEQFAIKLDACTCGGLWFDAGELSDWLARRGPVVRNPESHVLMPGTEPPRACPRAPCREMAPRTLESFVAGAARLGRCTHCRGFWVPQAALRTLMEGHAQRRTDPSKGADEGWGTALSHAVADAIGQILLGLF